MDTSNLSSPGLQLDQSDSPFTPAASYGSLISIKSTRSPTPRTSITPRQAIDPLELAITQSNDLQHILEKYSNQLDNEVNDVKNNINNQFNTMIEQLNQRKQVLLQQVSY